MPAEVDTLNRSMVAVRGDEIIIMRPLGVYTKEQALVLAATIVALVGDDERWHEVLAAVCNT